MAVTFYPPIDDTNLGTLVERIEHLMESAQGYKAAVLDQGTMGDGFAKPIMIPRDQKVAYNWEEMAMVLRLVREHPEASKTDRANKADLLSKLAEVYEMLRAARMPKLEAVRLALITEANHLRGTI